MRYKILYFSFLVSMFYTTPLFSQMPVLVNEKAGKDWLKDIQRDDINFYEVQAAFNNYWQNRHDYKGNGYKVFKRWEYINRFRVLPDGHLQAPGYVLNVYNKFLSEQPQNKSTSGQWTSLGPDTYPTNNTNQPTGMGRINALAFHPTDPAVIYAGAPSGGIWKTTNGGTSWASLSSDLPTLGVSAIVVNSSNPDIIYIGSGDRDADDAQGLGVFKTTDAGNSWTQVNTGMGLTTVGALIMHPSDPNTLLAATSTGIYKTTNAGSTWILKSSNTDYYKDIKFKPGDPSLIYATAEGKFYRSANTGETWTQVTSGLPSTGARQVIGVSGANPAYVYVAQVNTNQLYSGLYRSEDSGLNFSLRSSTPSPVGYQCDGTDYSVSQAFYDLCITVDPTDEDVIYIGAINIWKSTDGGSNFLINTHWVGSSWGTSCAPSVHADHHCLEWSPLNSALFSGNDGGIYRTTDSGTTWQEITANMGIAQVYKIGQSTLTSSLVINGYQDNGTSVLDGSSFTTVIAGDGTECQFDYTDNTYRYGSYVFGDIYRSTGGAYALISSGANGITENSVYLKSGAWVTPFMLHRSNPNTMFAAYSSVWRTTNLKAALPASVTWSAISTADGTCYVVEQSPANHDILYVVRSGSLKRSDNVNAPVGSVTWTTCALPGNLTPVDVKAHPSNENLVYAVAGYKVYKSTDKGMTWSDISLNLPALFVNCITYDKNSNEGLYIGNQTGVWYKDADMPAWVLFSNGLPATDIRELEIYYDDAQPENNNIKAATYGRGLWQSDMVQYDVTDPSAIAASAASTTAIDLTWVKNSGNDDVMVAYSLNGTFGAPVSGFSYTAGNAIQGGGTVIYKGSAAGFSHTSLTVNTRYYYKVWSVNSTLKYSCGTQVNCWTQCDPLTTLNETFEGNEMPNCWMVTDNQANGQVWKFGSYTNGTLPNLTGTYAYVHAADYGSGNAQNTDLITPLLNLSALTAVVLKFDHYYAHYSGTSANVYFSIDNGSNWTLLKTYAANTANAETVGINVPGAAGQSQVRFKFNFTSTDWGYYWAIDNVRIDGCSPGLWTGAFSTAWSLGSNWCGLSAPTTTTDVFIPEGVTYMPVVSGTVNNNCRDITISSGATLSMHPTNASTLNVLGNWTNNGTFNSALGTINFNATNELQTISGSSTTNFYKLTLTKGAQNRVLEATSVIGLTGTTNPLTLTSGTLKISSPSVITPFTSSSAIAAAAGLWNNGATINSGSLTLTVNGLFRNSDGITYVGSGNTHSLTYGANSIITIEGGEVIISGRLSGTAATTYTQTGGTLTVCNVGSSHATLAPFELTATSTFNMSGGTIVIPRASGNATDYENMANTYNVTGGTLQIGNATTSGSPSIRIYGTAPVYDLLVNSDGTPTLYINSSFTVKNNFTVEAGGVSISQNTYNLNLGGDWDYSAGAPVIGGTVIFNGTRPQEIKGSAVTNFYNVTLNNAEGLTLSSNVNATVRNLLTLTSGVITTGSNKLIMNLSTATISRTTGHIYGNLLKKIPTGTNVTRTFETGGPHDSIYTPVSVTFASVGTAGELTASAIQGDHPDIGASGMMPGLSVNRYWSLDSSGLSFTTYNAVFNYLNSDLDTLVQPSDLICGKYASGWTSPQLGTVTSGSLQILTQNSFSDFQLAEPAMLSLVSGGDWHTPGTWNPAVIPDDEDNVVIENGSSITVSSSGATCRSLFIRNGGELTISPSGQLSVLSYMGNDAGNGGLILLSDATGTASLIQPANPVDGTVQKYLSDQTTSGWNVSVPVTEAPVSVFSVSDGLYTYNPQTASWVAVNEGFLTPAKGYITRFGSGNGTENVTLNYSGILNYDNVSTGTLYRTGYQNGNFGWNLAGNPFTSAIDWNTIVGPDNQAFIDAHNVNPVIYIRKYDGNVAAYVANSGSGVNGGTSVIASMQAFWLQVGGSLLQQTGTGSFDFIQNARLHSASGLLKKDANPDVSIAATCNGLSDEMKVQFVSGATPDFDPAYDAVKMFSLNEDYPQLYAFSNDNEALTIYAVQPDWINAPVSLALKTGQGGVCTITTSVNAVGGFPEAIYLMDFQNDSLQDLNIDPAYTFSTNQGNVTDRFKLYFVKPVASVNESASVNDMIPVFYTAGSLCIGASDKVNTVVNVADVTGRQIFSRQLRPNELNKFSVNFSQGIYIVNITADDLNFTKKILIL